MGKLTELFGVSNATVLHCHLVVLFKDLDLDSQDPLQAYLI